MHVGRAHRLCFYAVICILWFAAAVGLVWHSDAVAASAFAHARNLRGFEAIGLALVFAWALMGVGINAAAAFVAELQPSKDRARPASVRQFYEAEATEPLLVMVPSYREEENTIWQTLMSAALAEHPMRDVVLLIDDPEAVAGTDEAVLLANARALPQQLQKMFDEAAAPFKAAYDEYRRREQAGDPREDRIAQARLYRSAGAWLEWQAESLVTQSGRHLTHTDRLFIDKILLKPARDLISYADEILTADLTAEAVAGDYFRLATLFCVRFSSFERKQFANLSHAPNKAMNLNVFMSLIGKSFQIVEAATGRELVQVSDGKADLMVRSYPFLVAIDADSLITHDYNIRLLSIMRAPGNERVAIAQSPYTAVPNAPTPVEHAAAASTDGQYFCHQGLAALGATSWVGAGALIRFAAMEDIKIERSDSGRRTTVYIKDDILIEDAAATIDLLRKGWRVYHTDHRLTYSATPADFGSLVIQRRRWANGGLLLLPRLVGVALQRPFSLVRAANALARMPNLVSAATNGLFFMIMISIPFDDDMLPAWMALMMLPSLLMTWHDLVRAGYRTIDIIPVQALSILLVPVNLSGTFQSIRQAINGRPVPFARTPKTAGRTPTPQPYVIAVYSLILLAGAMTVVDLVFHLYSHAAFAVGNAIILVYCLIRFMGVRASWDDACVPFLRSRSRFCFSTALR